MSVVPKRLVKIPLINVAARSAELLVEDCEREYQQRLERASLRIREAGAHIIMLTGPSGTGKTTTSHRLAAQLRKDGVPCKVISLDNFFLGSEHYPVLPDGTKDYECPETLDMPLINETLNQLYLQGHADLPVYDFKNECRASYTEHVELEGGVCIVEGIHALNPELTRILPPGEVFRVYASVREEYSSDGRRCINTRDIRLCRRLLRDATTRGHSPEKTLEMWNKVLEGENKYIKVYTNTADLILDTSHTYEICVIQYLIQKTRGMVSPQHPCAPLWESTVQKFWEPVALPVSVIPEGSMLKEFYGEL